MFLITYVHVTNLNINVLVISNSWHFLGGQLWKNYALNHGKRFCWVHIYTWQVLQFRNFCHDMSVTSGVRKVYVILAMVNLTYIKGEINLRSCKAGTRLRLQNLGRFRWTYPLLLFEWCKVLDHNLWVFWIFEKVL